MPLQFAFISRNTVRCDTQCHFGRAGSLMNILCAIGLDSYRDIYWRLLILAVMLDAIYRRL